MNLEDTMKVGFVGCGMMALRHLEAIKKMPDVIPASFCDVDLWKAEALGHEFDATVYSDVERMIDEENLDALYILVPAFAHGKAEKAAIAKWIPFFVEKPIGIDLDLCREIGDLVAKERLITSVGYHNRYRRTVQAAREIFSSDPPFLAYGGWVTGLLLPKDQIKTRGWGLQRQKTGGRLNETGGHTIDLLRYLMGEVLEVFAFAAPPRSFLSYVPDFYDLNDIELIGLRFESGALATVYVTVAANAGNGINLSIFSSTYAAHFTGWEHNLRLISAQPGKERKEQTLMAESPTWEDWDYWRTHNCLSLNEAKAGADVFFQEDRVFIDAVKSGNPGKILTTYPEALKTAEIILEIQRCADKNHGTLISFENRGR